MITYLSLPFAARAWPEVFADSWAAALAVTARYRCECRSLPAVLGGDWRHYDPGDQERAAHFRRVLILGDRSTAEAETPPGSPFGPWWPRRVPPVPPTARVWTFADCERDRDVELDAEVAGAAGIPVEVAPLPLHVLVRAAAKALAAEVARQAEAAAQEEPRDFRSAAQVVAVALVGAEPILGAPALDYGRAPGDGNPYRVRERIEWAGLRIAAAAGILARAARLRGWTGDTPRCLRLAFVEGFGAAQVAEALGWGDSEAAEKRVRRALATGLRLVREAMGVGEEGEG